MPIPVTPSVIKYRKWIRKQLGPCMFWNIVDIVEYKIVAFRLKAEYSRNKATNESP